MRYDIYIYIYAVRQLRVKVASAQSGRWHTELRSEGDYAEEALGQLPHGGWRQNASSCRIFMNARPGRRRGTGDD